MSNIGKIKIHIPPSLTIIKLHFDFNFYTLKFSGNLGSISINLPNSIKVINNGETLTILSTDNVMWGTTRNLIQQAITGVTTGFSKKLEIIGIGYKLSLSNNFLTFYLGKSHPVIIPIINDVKINVVNSTTLIASSISNLLLSNFLHSIRLIKPASKDHYKGKGIKVSTP